ncbi:EAL domain-containing protein [Bradyrhizobium roseum]|uniref:EAL domain-containing protein n=1 Tax=Bradyrhizobium roseum TaxID=3056648 RepID=UPI002636F178|nr:EAL domain-containing protein [Bradyrhizobium roseus]WKA31297.1 EAL domain-containing protein [Bradyrhizobium roseus]
MLPTAGACSAFRSTTIEIDRSFVREVTRNESSASIIRAVVSIAADRNMLTTAEGVETLQQRETVQTLGCTRMQGFLFGAARPAQEIRKLLVAKAGVEDAA